MNNELEKMDFKKLLEVFLANIKFIVAVTVFFAVGLFVYSQTMIIPMYTASTTLYVNNVDSDMRYEDKMLGTDITASQMLVPTCVQIIKSNRMLNKVADNDELNYSAGRIGSMVSTTTIEDTEIFKITITCSDPEVAAQIANTFAKVAPDVISEIIDASSVKVIDYAIPSNVKVSPNIATNTMLGFVIGLVLSCAFLAIREMFDVRVKSEEDLEKEFAYPILGVIPKIGTDNSGQESYYYRNSYYGYGKRGAYYGRNEESRNNQ